MKKTLASSVIIVLMVITLASCSFNVTTANFKNVQTASEVDGTTNTPVTVTSTFNTGSPIIYVTGSANNAPEGTVIKAEWLYTEQEPAIDIDSATLELKDVNTDFAFNLSKPTNGWPTGAYEVKLYIDDEYKQSVNFEVK